MERPSIADELFHGVNERSVSMNQSNGRDVNFVADNGFSLHNIKSVRTHDEMHAQGTLNLWVLSDLRKAVSSSVSMPAT